MKPIQAQTLLASLRRRAASTLTSTALASASTSGVTTTTKEAGDISSVFPSLSGKTPQPLPARFADLKRSLIRGRESAVAESWQRLLAGLKGEIDEIRGLGCMVSSFVLLLLVFFSVLYGGVGMGRKRQNDKKKQIHILNKSF